MSADLSWAKLLFGVTLCVALVWLGAVWAWQYGWPSRTASFLAPILTVKWALQLIELRLRELDAPATGGEGA